MDSEPVRSRGLPGPRPTLGVYKVHQTTVPSTPHRKMGGRLMGASEYRNWLLDMKADAEARLEKAQADYDAIVRTIAFHDERALPGPASVEEVRVAATLVLAQRGEPTHRQAILNELEDMGIRVSGKDPVSNLGSILSRFAKDFKSHGNGVWGLKTWSAYTPAPAPNGDGSHSLLPSQDDETVMLPTSGNN